uniref:Uncharacterized protein n=1 Tax=Pseudomonas phage HRDY3 TaxID=3236930 RepID=A0AB39CEL8_9VIRU
MRFKFDRSVFENPAVYETVVQTLLIGYAKNVNRLAEQAKNGSQFDVNVILFGITEASAKIRASDTFKGTNYVNIRCVGADSDLKELGTLFQTNRFNGHVIVCPEVEHARDHVYVILAQLLDKIGSDLDHRAGRYDRDFKTVLPNRQVESDLLWAMFEQWKMKTYGAHRQVLIENANYRFTKYFDFGKGEDFLARQAGLRKGIATGDEPKDGNQFAPPHELDPLKTFDAMIDPYKRIDYTNLHPVRMGRDFTQLRISSLREVVDAVCPYGVGIMTAELENPSVRTLCLDDNVAWNIFKNSINIGSYYPQEYQAGEGCAAEYAGDRDREVQIVHMEEISKK